MLMYFNPLIAYSFIDVFNFIEKISDYIGRFA